MKRMYYFSILLFSIFSINSSIAQRTSGIVKYKAEINSAFRKQFIEEMKKKETSAYVKQQVIKWYQEASPDYYVLNFKNGESYYEYQEALELEAYNIGSKAGQTDFYINTETEAIIESSPHLGYLSYRSINWQLTNESKIINDYKCYKAVGKDIVYSRKENHTVEEVVAWFSPEIPLNFGPRNYYGLPGLILQIETEKFTINATEINLKPDKKIKIKKLNEKENIRTQDEAYQVANEYRDRLETEFGN